MTHREHYALCARVLYREAPSTRVVVLSCEAGHLVEARRCQAVTAKGSQCAMELWTDSASEVCARHGGSSRPKWGAGSWAEALRAAEDDAEARWAEDERVELVKVELVN